MSPTGPRVGYREPYCLLSFTPLQSSSGDYRQKWGAMSCMPSLEPIQAKAPRSCLTF
jgi:hypothetical protein